MKKNERQGLLMAINIIDIFVRLCYYILYRKKIRLSGFGRAGYSSIFIVASAGKNQSRFGNDDIND